MSEIVDNVISEIYGAWRFRWWGMLLAWVLALGGWTYISLMPNEFEASARVLVNTNTDLREIIRRQGLTIPPDIISEVEQVRIAKECAEWLSEKAEIQAVNDSHIVNQSIFHVNKGNGDSIAVQGSSNFTSSGLGYVESDHYDMNMLLSNTTATESLLEWFDSIWQNPNAVSKIKAELLGHLELMTKENGPEYIYFLVLFNIFKEFKIIWIISANKISVLKRSFHFWFYFKT